MKHLDLRRTTLALLLAAGLGACGGGGGSPGTTGSGAPTMPGARASITLELVDRNGNKVDKLTGTSVAIARATVFDSSGAPAANARVKFNTGTLLVTTPADGVATTTTAGVALINVQAASNRSLGKETIIASAPALGEGVADEISVEVDGTVVR